MGVTVDAIEKAKARAAGLDLRRLVSNARDKRPVELGDERQFADRRSFLDQSLGRSAETAAVFERIINGSELQDVNYLARGARAARAVARIVIRDSSGRLRGYGTGFLIAPNVLITNNHVLPDEGWCVRSEVQFEYELDIDANPIIASAFGLEPGRLFLTSKALDFTVVAVGQRHSGNAELSQYGCLPLVGRLGKVVDGEWLTIVQHPNGDRKQVCVRENKLLTRKDDVLWYSSDTLGGSSGSPVFNNDWYVVALHHSGVPEEIDGRIQTIYGRPFDRTRDAEQDIQWIANEGIRVSRIVDALEKALGEHPMLQAMFRMTPEGARIEPPALKPPLPYRNGSQRILLMNDRTVPPAPRTVTVTLAIEPGGSVNVVRSDAGALAEGAVLLEAAKKKRPKPPAFDVPFNAAYDDRKGYRDDFLAPGKAVVRLPQLSAALTEEAAKLINPEGKNKYVLHYHNYSVVMHARRRFAIYSAANVDFAGRYDVGRPADVWREDPRIPLKCQLTNFYYRDNQFDRGHLTRREDLEFGPTLKDAMQSAADTCHWTNCTPQHSRFNQNKELWQGIERHVLENAIERNDFKAQVITGPILEEDDPEWERFKGIQYPVRFWKVVSAVNASGRLFATAYILDQSEVIDKYGIEAAPEVPFEEYKTYQVSIREVERLTQLTFTGGDPKSPTALSDFDPLKAGVSRRRAGRVRRVESIGSPIPDGYLPLESLDSIEL